MTKIIPNIEIFTKVGATQNNRVLYKIEQDGTTAHMTIPKEQEDTFDKINNQIADELKNMDNSKKGQPVILLGGILGCGAGYFLTRNKRAISTALATLGLGVAGMLGSGFAYMYPTINRIKKHTQQLESFDIKPYNE